MLDRLSEWAALAEEILTKKNPRTDFSTGIEIHVDKRGKIRMRVRPNIRRRRRRRRSLEDILSKYPPGTTLKVGEPLPAAPAHQEQAASR